MTATDFGSNCREQIRLASGNLGRLKRLNTCDPKNSGNAKRLLELAILTGEPRPFRATR